VRVGYVVESKNAEAETEEQESTERHESPKRQHRDNLLLNEGRERNQAQEEREVERGDQKAKRDSLLGASHAGRRFFEMLFVDSGGT
jgi:hypothetical protein